MNPLVMSRTTIYTLTGSLVVASVVLLLLIFFLPRQKTSNTSTTSQTQSPNYPVNIDNPDVFTASVDYTFSVTIQEIGPIPEGFEIIPEKEIPNAPKFIMCKTCEPPTQLFAIFKKTPLRIDYKYIKMGQKIRLTAVYNLKTKGWSVARITILDPVILPTTPSLNTPASTSSAR